MTILFEVVRWILIAGFATLGAFMFRMVIVAAMEADTHKHAGLRFFGGWIILMLCTVLAAVTFTVTP